MYDAPRQIKQEHKWTWNKRWPETMAKTWLKTMQPRNRVWRTGTGNSRYQEFEFLLLVSEPVLECFKLVIKVPASVSKKNLVPEKVSVSFNILGTVTPHEKHLSPLLEYLGRVIVSNLYMEVNVGFKGLSKISLMQARESNMWGHWEEGWTSPTIKRFLEGKAWGKSWGRRICLPPVNGHQSIPSKKFANRV